MDLVQRHTEVKQMAAKDAFHGVVKSALQKDGWKITHDPLYINFAEVEIFVDLGAEREGDRIAVEIKTFLNPSAISEFHTALGQFLNYRFALKADDPERILYLAVPCETFDIILHASVCSTHYSGIPT